MSDVSYVNINGTTYDLNDPTLEVEILDARDGYDGTEYGTIGEAIRGQVSDLHNAQEEDEVAIGRLQNSFANVYSSSSTYEVGDYALYEGQLYRCATDIESGEEWNSSHWELAQLAADVSDAAKLISENAEDIADNASAIATNTEDIANNATAIERVEGLIAPDFSTSTTYSIGDYCLYGGTLYRFINAHTGAWSASDVVAVNVGGEVGEIKSAITNLTDNASAEIYSGTAISVYQTSNDWKLLDSGLCTSDSNYKLVKFKVVAGNLYEIKSGDKFQFQSAATVPATGAPYRVGSTYGEGTYIVECPTGASYLIISTKKTVEVASASVLMGKISNLEEKAEAVEWNGVGKNLIGMDEGRLYPVFLPTGTYLTISTSDNQMGNMAFLDAYDSNKTRVAYYAIFDYNTTTKRTIQLGNDIYYLGWRTWTTPITGQLQVEIGQTKTAFEPWYPGVRAIQTEFDDITYMVDLDVDSTLLSNYITQMGGSEPNSGFNIKKYRVTQRDILDVDIKFPFVSSGGVFQFQTESDVPYGTNPYIVGTTYNAAFKGQIVVPDTAKWLMVTVKSNATDTNTIKLQVTSGFNTLNDRITDFEPDANYTYKLNHYKNVSSQYRKGNTSGSWYDRFVLFHLSDSHIGTTFAQNNLIELGKIANDNLPAAIINSGDMTNAGLASYTRDITNGEFDIYTDIFTDNVSDSVPIISTLGNHDSNDISTEYISHASTKEDQWGHVFAPIASKFSSIVWGDSAHYRHYHYYDIAKGSYTLRVIALDSLDHDDYQNGDSSYECQWYEVYSQEQIDWLCDTALNVPSANYGIVIVNHFPFAPYRASGYSEEWPALNDGYFVQGWKMIPEIVRAWSNRTSLSKTYTDTKLGENNITVNVNFSSVPSGARFVCYMVGHTHSKNAFIVKEENGENFEQLMLCEDSSGQQGSALCRVYKYDNGIQNTVASQVSIDLAERKVYRTAYGAYQHCSIAPQAETDIFEF